MSAASRVALAEASPVEAPVVERLLQLYQYDFSEIEGGIVDSTGLYRYISLAGYWASPGHHAFLVRVDGELAGLVLVKPGSITGRHPAGRIVDEFFVMRKYRRRGVGREVARRVFDTFPGRWELNQTTNNVVARAFWRGVLDEYTAGRFDEVTVNGRPTQSFVTKPH